MCITLKMQLTNMSKLKYELRLLMDRFEKWLNNVFYEEAVSKLFETAFLYFLVGMLYYQIHYISAICSRFTT